LQRKQLGKVFDTAINHKDWAVRWKAIQTLTDQSVLADIAKNDKYLDVGEAAIES
jgi:hypothetical protein